MSVGENTKAKSLRAVRLGTNDRTSPDASPPLGMTTDSALVGVLHQQAQAVGPNMQPSHIRKTLRIVYASFS